MQYNESDECTAPLRRVKFKYKGVLLFIAQRAEMAFALRTVESMQVFLNEIRMMAAWYWQNCTGKYGNTVPNSLWYIIFIY